MNVVKITTGKLENCFAMKISAADKATVQEFIDGMQALVAGHSSDGCKAVLVSNERFAMPGGAA